MIELKVKRFNRRDGFLYLHTQDNISFVATLKIVNEKLREEIETGKHKQIRIVWGEEKKHG